MKGLYKKIDRNMCAWDLSAGCNRYIDNSKKSRRALKKRLRRMARKKINNYLT